MCLEFKGFSRVPRNTVLGQIGEAGMTSKWLTRGAAVLRGALRVLCDAVVDDSGRKTTSWDAAPKPDFVDSKFNPSFGFDGVPQARADKDA